MGYLDRQTCTRNHEQGVREQLHESYVVVQQAPTALLLAREAKVLCVIVYLVHSSKLGFREARRRVRSLHSGQRPLEDAL